MAVENSELTQITAITAVGNSDDEDFIVQLVDSQGWQIRYRAVDLGDLEEYFLHQSDDSSDVLIIRSDFQGFDISRIVDLKPAGLQIISLDGTPVTSHLIMTHLRAELRNPTFKADVERQDKAQSSEQTHRPVIAISGTSGSPGMSRLAIDLAGALLSQSQVVLWEIEGSGGVLDYLWEQEHGTSSGSELEIRSIPSGSDVNQLTFSHDELHILDLGTFPELAHLAQDRRWRPHLINYLLDNSDHLIYTVAATGLHLLWLEEFVTNFPKQLRSIPITYLLTPHHNSRSDRAIEERFRKLTEGERALVLAPEDSRGRAQSLGQLLLLIDERD